MSDTCNTSACKGEVFGCTLSITEKAGSNSLGGGCEGAVIEGTQSGLSADFTLGAPGMPGGPADFTITMAKDGNTFKGSYVYKNGQGGTTIATRQGVQACAIGNAGAPATEGSNVDAAEPPSADARGQERASFRPAIDAPEGSCGTLQITLATSPAQLTLEVNDKGAVVPGKVTVTVTFTNTTKATIDTAQLLLLAPEPVVRSQQLNKLTLSAGSLPLSVGPFPPSSHASRKFTLTVTGDGKYQWRALAIFADASRAGGNGRAVGQGGQFTVKTPLLYFKATQQDTEVKAGGSWYVTGQVKNLSSFQTLCLSPLQPRFSDNAGGLGPHQIGVVPVDDPAPPVAGPLTPEQTVLFLERVQTEALAPTAGGVLVGTSSGVVLAPQATLGAAGDKCKVEDIDKRAPVAMSDIKVAPGSRFFQVDVTPGAPSAVGAGTLEYFGAYATRTAGQIAQLYESGCSLVKQYSSVDNLVAAFGRGAQGLLDAQEAVSNLYHSAAMGAMFWHYAEPAERSAFEDQVVDAFLQKGGPGVRRRTGRGQDRRRQVDGPARAGVHQR